jgi:hypothetical protein
MPRRAVVPQDSLGDRNYRFPLVSAAPHVSLELAPGSAHEGVYEHATRLLAHAHSLLAQEAIRLRSLEECLVVLQHAAPATYFRHTLDPPTLTLAPYRRRGTHEARLLRRRFEVALVQTRERSETIRLNTLLALARIGVPIALWHFIVPTPLPHDPHSLAPQAQRA